MIATLPAPSYTPAADAAPRYSLQLSDPASADGDTLAPPPAYTPPTPPGVVQLQIQTPGKRWLSLPTPTRPDPISVFDVSNNSGNGGNNTPLYVSLRQSRGSGTCCLVAGDNTTALSDTTYRFGPGRPPRIRLWLPGHGPSAPGSAADSNNNNNNNNNDNGNGNDNDDDTYEAFEIRPSGLLTRAHRFRTRHHGEFEWRYATRRERADVAGRLAADKEETVDNLLVLERIVRVFRDPRAASSSAVVTGGPPDGVPDEERTVVAQLVRGGGGLRARGSTVRDAGNGGRLFVDVAAFGSGGDDKGEDGGSGKDKADRDMAVVLAVTTCLCMLKKEVDRRRMQQMAIMAGAASGGGP